MSAPPRIRRIDKLMPDEEAHALLERGYCGRLATVAADGYPYCVPLLYVCMDREIWVHNTAQPGHLRASVEHETRVCFETDEPGEVFPFGRFECDSSLAYASVVAFGRIRVVTETEGKQRFCEKLMTKYGDPSWQRLPNFFPRLGLITVYAITVERLTGKKTLLPDAAQRWPAVDKTTSPNAVPP